MTAGDGSQELPTGSGRLEGRSAVVTGGGRGIGRAIALRFAAEGADVAVTARSVDQLNEVADLAGGLGDGAGRIIAIGCDVSSDESVAAMAAEATEAFGEVDIVVNNAGIHAGGRFTQIEPDAYVRLFDVNVVSIVRVSQAFLPGMVERAHGRIVNIASTAGLFESAGQAPYNTSKHAAVGLTRCMGLELAPTGVTVNAICPGFVDTPMIDGFASNMGVEADTLRSGLADRTPMGRILDPSEIAALAVHAASDEAGGMTGQTMVVSNGMRMA